MLNDAIKDYLIEYIKDAGGNIEEFESEMDACASEIEEHLYNIIPDFIGNRF